MINWLKIVYLTFFISSVVNNWESNGKKKPLPKIFVDVIVLLFIHVSWFFYLSSPATHKVLNDLYLVRRPCRHLRCCPRCPSIDASGSSRGPRPGIFPPPNIPWISVGPVYRQQRMTSCVHCPNCHHCCLLSAVFAVFRWRNHYFRF